MSTHNICFCGAIRKMPIFFFWKKIILSRAVYDPNFSFLICPLSAIIIEKVDFFYKQLSLFVLIYLVKI